MAKVQGKSTFAPINHSITFPRPSAVFYEVPPEDMPANNSSFTCESGIEEGEADANSSKQKILAPFLENPHLENLLRSGCHVQYSILNREWRVRRIRPVVDSNVIATINIGRFTERFRLLALLEQVIPVELGNLNVINRIDRALGYVIETTNPKARGVGRLQYRVLSELRFEHSLPRS